MKELTRQLKWRKQDPNLLSQIDALQERLNRYQTVGWVVSDEDNLETIPESAPDSIKNIAKYLVVRNRKLRMEEWYGSLKDDQRMHGSIIGIGARTHRCAHRNPNMGNIPAIKKKGKVNYMGSEYRSVWGVPPLNIIKSGKYDNIYKTHDERRLIGVDAEGIQLRILAHYMNDPDYTRAVSTGDPHSYNMFAAGINPGFPNMNEQKVREKFGKLLTREEAIELHLGKKDGLDWSGRDVAKTFIYAFLLGAGNGKILEITGIPGQKLKDRFYDEIPALDHLINTWIPEQMSQGFTLGVDGRVFLLDKIPQHKVLSILLQAGETVVMKLALHFTMMEIYKRNLDAFVVAFVHDEFQIDSALHCAEEVKLIAESAIVRAGEYLNLNCPMAAEGRIGLNWRDTH
jgi:DNA polymerase-1